MKRQSQISTKAARLWESIGLDNIPPGIYPPTPPSDTNLMMVSAGRPSDGSKGLFGASRLRGSLDAPEREYLVPPLEDRWEDEELLSVDPASSGSNRSQPSEDSIETFDSLDIDFDRIEEINGEDDKDKPDEKKLPVSDIKKLLKNYSEMNKRMRTLGPTRGPEHLFGKPRERSIGASAAGAYADSLSAYADSLSAKSLSARTEPGESKSKPDGIVKLEHLLSELYGKEVWVTSVNELPQTRKEVKEVYILAGTQLSKIWLFKAEPGKTEKELTTYYVASERDVPTGKPIGFVPNASHNDFPFEFAMLGGAIISDAGGPYNKLIGQLILEPRAVYLTAKSIAAVVAKYHHELTKALDELSQYGVDLPKADVRKELEERMFAALKITDTDPRKRYADMLVESWKRLYQKQSSALVVSHGDLHTGNIVTPPKPSGQSSVDISRYGIIDWETARLSNPYDDLCSYWIHFQRLVAKELKGNKQLWPRYSESKILSNFSSFAEGYADELSNLGGEFRAGPVDAVIQHAFWQTLEIYDPVRKDMADVKEKAIMSFKDMKRRLETIEEHGYRAECHDIMKALNGLLKDKDYLREYMQD